MWVLISSVFHVLQLVGHDQIHITKLCDVFSFACFDYGY